MGPTKLTYSRVAALKPGSTLSDPTVPGLRFYGKRAQDGREHIYASYRYKLHERWTSKGLGRLPAPSELAPNELGGGVLTATLEPFRMKARKLGALLRAGGDPHSDIGPEGRTLQQALDLHIEDMEKAGKSPLSIAEYELAARHLDDWRNAPLRRITGDMVRQRHKKLGDTVGKGAADKTMRMLRAVYNTAQALDTSLPANPTKALRRAWYKLPPRKSALRTRDFEKWGKELAKLRAEGRFGELRADFFALMLLTGMRKSALASIRREHVDTSAHTIFIPKPKGGEDRAFTLPLSNEAWKIVKRRLAATNSEWLFPSPQNPKEHLRTAKAYGTFSAWKDGAGKPIKFTPHGLRATFIGAGHAAGVSDRYVMLLANHALHKGDVHGGYVPEDDIPAMAKATQRITDYLKTNGLRL